MNTNSNLIDESVIVPDNIDFPDHVFDIDFHPSNNLVAAGMINGIVQV